MRAALYARFSKEDQNPLSVADQLALCRRYAEQIGATVAAEHEFYDEGISGFSTGNRPGIQRLLATARARHVDVVIAEHSDRISRGLSGSGAIYEDLKAWGVRYVTVNQGAVTLATAGLSGLVSAMTLEEGANKTRRGLRSRVEAGRNGGGLTYGYRLPRAYDAAGERVRGLLEVDPEEADIVRRIFRDYAAGASPRAIASALNLEGVRGPRGGPWNASTIHGNPKRGHGVLHNELYRGIRVWGKLTFVKDRVTGRRRGLEGGQVTRAEIPELRILSDEEWDAAAARYRATAVGPQAARSGQNRPKGLLSGLIRCGVCGGPMNKAGPSDALRCATRAARGPSGCTNTRAPGYAGIERRVLESVQANMLHPVAIEVFAEEFQAELSRRRKARAGDRLKLERELAEAKRRMDHLVRQVEEGMPWSAAADRHKALGDRCVEIEAELGAEAAAVVQLHPPAVGLYRQLVAALREAADDTDLLEGMQVREAVRALIAEVRFIPGEGRGEYALEVTGELAPLLAVGGLTANENGPARGGAVGPQYMRAMGAGTRFGRPHISRQVRWAA